MTARLPTPRGAFPIATCRIEDSAVLIADQPIVRVEPALAFITL